jgi:hypothetical protein
MRIMRAIDDVHDKIKWYITKGGGELNRRCAVRYTQLLVRNIMTDKYAGRYAAYHPKYAYWKRTWFAGGGHWRLKGDLVRAIHHFKYKHGWVGGLRGDEMDSGGKSWPLGFGWTTMAQRAHGWKGKGKKKKIAMYATVGEFGGDYGEGGKHPSRPVFGPTMNEFKVGEWVKQINIMFRDIEKEWA